MRPLDSSAVALSRLSRGGFAWVAAAAVQRDRRLLVETAASSWIADGLALATSHAIGRERPCRRLPALIECPDSPSFPSNHAATAFAAAGVLPGAWWLVPAAAVAASRVRCGVHTAGDVVAGAALGLAVARVVRSVAIGSSR